MAKTKVTLEPWLWILWILGVCEHTPCPLTPHMEWLYWFTFPQHCMKATCSMFPQAPDVVSVRVPVYTLIGVCLFLIGMFLMPNDVKHIFMGLFCTHKSSVKCLFMSFGHFFNWVVWLLLLNLENSLFILDTSPLSDICFVRLYSQCVACLFILFTYSFTRQKFAFWWSKIYQFFLP